MTWYRLPGGRGRAVIVPGMRVLETLLPVRPWQDLESQAARLRQLITVGNAARAPLIDSQLTELSAALFGSSPPAPGSRLSNAVGGRGGASRVARYTRSG